MPLERLLALGQSARSGCLHFDCSLNLMLHLGLRTGANGLKR